MEIVKVWFVFTALFFVTEKAKCANILGVFGSPVRSHQIFFRGIWKELALRGHNMTVISAVPLRDPNIKNLREIDWSFALRMADEFEIFQTAHSHKNDPNFFDRIMDNVEEIIAKELQHSEVQALIEDPSADYDLVLTEFFPSAYFYFGEIFDCPIIQLSSMPVFSFTKEEIGNPSSPVINPDINLPFGKKLNFIQRLLTVSYDIWVYWLMRKYSSHGQNRLAKMYLAKGKPVDLIAIQKERTSLVISNVVPGITNPHPRVPALVEVHGLNLIPPKPLPQEIQTFLDSATDGAIYFSLGTTVRTEESFIERYKVFAEVFSKLPYKVVWKLDVENLTLDSNKILAQKWFNCQQDILRHPKVKLFITQGGLHSLEETIAYRVPILGMPFFGDQMGNVKKLVEIGMGLELDFDTATKEEIQGAILEVITNQRYSKKVQEIQEAAFDKPMEPMNETIWWIEYVIRHKGAQYLRSPYVDMNWIERYSLDVACTFIVAGLLVLYGIKKFLQFTLTLLRKINQPKKMKTN